MPVTFLTNEDKTQLEEQINQLKESIANIEVEGVTEETLQNAVNNYLVENPIEVGDTYTSNVIDIEKYGIVQADYVEPFTADMYNVAYNNGVSIQNAINEAKANGLTEIILPSGNYPLCYSGEEDLCSNPIIDSQGINFVGYGAKLYVIYDEEGTNPYFTGETPRLLQGKIIVTDSDVRGFHLVGERGYRKAEETKYRENSSCICLMPYTRGNDIKDCICELVSGDGIACGQLMEQLAGWPNEVFTSVDWSESENAFVESTTVYTSSEQGVTWLDDMSKPLLIRTSSYFMYTVSPLRILCFNENDEFIGSFRFRQGEYFKFLPNTAKWYLQMFREVEHETTATETIPFWIGYGYYCDTTIDNCEIRFNQRGGISNVPSGSVIKNCDIHHNGCEYNGMPAFYDSTQFGIDIEDVFIHDVTIEDCFIHNNFQGVLYRCSSITFKNCDIYGYVVSLNYGIDFYAVNTRFYTSCTMNYPAPFGVKTAIGCKFSGSVEDTINVIGRGVAKASVSKEDENTVVFMDSLGNTLFEVDLTMLGKKPGEDIITNKLLFNLDFTQATTDNLTITDSTGNMSATVFKSNAIVENGVCVSTAYTNMITCNWLNTPSINQDFAFEIVCFGMPNKATPFIGSYQAAGRTLSETHIYNSNPSAGVYACRSYTNVNGESISMSSSESASGKVYLDDGTTVWGNDNAISDLNATKFYHFVVNFYSNGTVEIYFNGYLTVYNPTITDFVSWNPISVESFDMWNGQTNTSQIIKSMRMYNRCLTKEEVRNNKKYEENKLGL